MASIAIPVYGGAMKWNTTTTTYTAITEAKALVVPTVEVEYVDVTSLDSPNAFREYLPTLRDGGTLSLECNFSEDLWELAKSYLDDDTLVYFETSLAVATGNTTAATFEFAGYVRPETDFTDLGGVGMMTIGIRTSGDVTLTKGT